ncbi:four helix bundle protein [candidate division WS5 bacterium]|uniref:Four helix bundle protein n=1 Tax=candidate division WS5 bacterium TaxID=2093353 RepID=A0A419DGK7_9BACT|nr:MAG: four helix bundle protein [candidate division WS5 bacterium]
MQNDKSKFKNDFYRRLIRFSLSIIKLCKFIREDRNLWPVADQLIRSATSVGANVVEAKSSSSKREYIKFFEIALKSANETIYWLMIVEESYPKIQAETMQLLAESKEISKIIGSSVLTMKGKK